MTPLLQSLEFLDRLDDENLITLCKVSRPFQATCRRYLPVRARQRFGKGVSSINEYIKLVTESGALVRGSERYITSEDALFRAAMIADLSLITYFQDRVDSCERFLIPLIVAILKNDKLKFQRLYPLVMEECPEKDEIDNLIVLILGRSEASVLTPQSIEQLRRQRGTYTLSQVSSARIPKLLNSINSAELADYLNKRLFGGELTSGIIREGGIPFIERFIKLQGPGFQVRQLLKNLISRGIDLQLLAEHADPRDIERAIGSL